MTQELSADLDPRLTEPHASNKLLKALLLLLQQEERHEDIESTALEAGLPLAYLQDERQWCSATFVSRFCSATAHALFGCTDLPAYDHPYWQLWRRAAWQTVTPKALGSLWPILRAVGSPGLAYRNYPVTSRYVNHISRVEVVEHAPGLVVLRVWCPNPEVQENAAACWSRIGAFEAMPTVWGLPRAQIEHPECMFHPTQPATRCVYRISFQPVPYREYLWTLALAMGGAAVGLAMGWQGPLPWAVSLLGAGLGIGFDGWRRHLGASRTHHEDIARLGEALAEADRHYGELWQEEQELRRMLLANRKISGYLSADLVKQIMENPDMELALGGAMAEAAVLFADIVGYTPRCESLQPQQVVDELNIYWSHIDPEIERHGGVIDKRMGDGVMVVFVNRQGETDPTLLRRRAVLCGIGILDRLVECNRQLAERGSNPLRIRVGLAAGPLVQGNMGSALKLEYTVIGDVVNLAARLEGQATPMHLLTTRDILPDVAEVAEIVSEREIRVKGKGEPIQVVELRPRECQAGFFASMSTTPRAPGIPPI